MPDYKSMRKSYIEDRLRALSDDNAGANSPNMDKKGAVVANNTPETAAAVLKSEGSTSKARLDRQPRKCGGRAMKKAIGGPASGNVDPAKVEALAKLAALRAAKTGQKIPGRAAGGPAHDDAAADLKMMKEGHPDEAEDKAMIREMVKKDALTGKKAGGRTPRATGGRTKGSTTINIVMPSDNKEPMPIPIPVGGAPQNARPQMQAPQQVSPQVNPGVNQNAMQQARPQTVPTLALKTGGRVPSFTAGSGSGEGRLEKTDHAKKMK